MINLLLSCSHGAGSQTTGDLCLTLQKGGEGCFLWPICVAISTPPKVMSAGDPPNPQYVKYRNNNLLSSVFLKVMWFYKQRYHWEIQFYLDMKVGCIV